MIPENYTAPCIKYLRTTGEVIGHGAHHYDTIIARHNRLHPALIASMLAREYSADFYRPGAHLDPVDWALLTVIPANLVYLVDPTFVPADFLIAAIQDTSVEDLMAEQEAAHKLRLGPVLRTLTDAIMGFDHDEQKAMWTVLSFARSAELTTATLSATRWFTADFIGRWTPLGL